MLERPLALEEKQRDIAKNKKSTDKHNTYPHTPTTVIQPEIYSAVRCFAGYSCT